MKDLQRVDNSDRGQYYRSMDSNENLNIISDTAFDVLIEGEPLEFRRMNDAADAAKQKYEHIKGKVAKALKEYMGEMPKEKDMEETRGVFEVVMVNADECDVIKQKTVVAKDEQEAILQLAPSDDQVKRLRKGIYKTIVFNYGTFRVYAKPIKIE